MAKRAKLRGCSTLGPQRAAFRPNELVASEERFVAPAAQAGLLLA